MTVGAKVYLLVPVTLRINARYTPLLTQWQVFSTIQFYFSTFINRRGNPIDLTFFNRAILVHFQNGSFGKNKQLKEYKTTCLLFDEVICCVEFPTVNLPFLKIKQGNLHETFI